jgi:hypothetical protein
MLFAPPGGENMRSGIGPACRPASLPIQDFDQFPNDATKMRVAIAAGWSPP